VKLVSVPLDEEGMQVEYVEELLHTLHPSVIYTIPTFQNPTGVCLSGHRRRQLIALAERFNVPVLEDEFVGDLRYEGPEQPTLKALDPGGYVLYVGTFSKMMMPSLRIGYIAASGPVYERLLTWKRIQDLATSNLLQRALERYITVGRYEAHLRRTTRLYRTRRDAMLKAMTQYLPEGIRWTTPSGGLYIWVQLPEGCSTNKLLPIAVEQGVAFTPGSPYFPEPKSHNYLRLNFSLNPPEMITEGIRRLGLAIQHYFEMDLS
jgi:GntR family transcriptional regulator/MocR family aminotransferase